MILKEKPNFSPHKKAYGKAKSRNHCNRVYMAKSTGDERLTLYTAETPNGFKASITLEELGINYRTHAIDLKKKEQKEDWFLKINPNGRIPALVDHNNNDLAIFESGAIMIYLAEHFNGDNLLPKDSKTRYEIYSWLMFQMGGIGPMAGQFHFFTHAATELIPLAVRRYHDESKRLWSVLETRLSDGREYLTGDYSLADIANFSWVVFHPMTGLDLDDYPNIKAWVKRIYKREAVKRGLGVPNKFRFKEEMENEAKCKQTINETLIKAGLLSPSGEES
eukprot:g3935.t1